MYLVTKFINLHIGDIISLMNVDEDLIENGDTLNSKNMLTKRSRSTVQSHSYNKYNLKITMNKLIYVNDENGEY